MQARLFDIKRKKDSTLNFIESAYDEGKLMMSDRYRQWALNLVWTAGDQNVDFNSVTKQFERVVSTQTETRLTSNLMMPIVRANVARLNQINAIWDMIPATSDEEDLQISYTSAKLLKDYWTKLGMNSKLLRALFWQETTGSVFFKVGWDSDAGELVQVPTQSIEEERLIPLLELMGFSEPPKEVELQSGETFVEPVPPFNILADPLAPVFDDSDWCVETQIRSLDWIVNRYGNKWKDKLNESKSTEQLLYPYILSDNNEQLPKRGVLTHELHIKHTKRFKKGLYAFVADGQVIDGPRDHPYDHGQLPYIMMISIYDPMSMWGNSIPRQIRSQQARYNRLQSFILDHVYRCANIQWLVPRRANLKNITNQVGAILQYDGPLPPTQTKVASLPAYVSEITARTAADIQNTSSIHNVSQGKNEPGVRSAKTVEILKSSDDEVLGPSFIFMDEALTRMGVQLLQLTVQYVAQERLMAVTGDFNEQSLEAFTGASLVGKSQGDYFKVRVKTAVKSALSRSAREAQVYGLLERGILDPVRDREYILGVIGLSDSMSLADSYAGERTRQWKEIQDVIAGKEILVIMGENHEVHIKAIKRFIASSKRNELDPKQLAAVVKHMQDHMMMRGLELRLEMGALADASQQEQTGGSGRQQGGQQSQGSQGSRPGAGRSS